MLEVKSIKGGPVRVSLEPAPTNAAAVAASAKRLLGNMRGSYTPSGAVARRLGVSSRTLGRMTGGRGGAGRGGAGGRAGRAAWLEQAALCGAHGQARFLQARPRPLPYKVSSHSTKLAAATLPQWSASL